MGKVLLQQEFLSIRIFIRWIMGFFLDGSANDPVYANLRDLPRGAPYRIVLESLWKEFEPLAELNFRSKAMHHCYECAWEMYLAVTLKQRGFDVTRSSTKGGPDFKITRDGVSCYVEATAPGPGDGADSVPDLSPSSRELPEEQTMLRFTNALSEKKRQYERAIAKKLVDPEASYVVAMNGARINFSGGEGTLPIIVRAMLGRGPLVNVWNCDTKDVKDSYFKDQDSVEKQSGNSVPTNCFLTNDYAMVSGILFCWSGFTNYPEVFGSEYVFVRNKNAASQTPESFFPFCREFWVEGPKLIEGSPGAPVT